MKEKIVINWFRNDLRIQDNLSLYYASKLSKTLCVYIYDDSYEPQFSPGSASKAWLFRSLNKLNETLDNNLKVFIGDAVKVFEKLTTEFEVSDVFCNKSYEPHQIEKDLQIKNYLSKIGINFNSYNSSLLWDPEKILKNDGNPYKVFTPFYRKGCLPSGDPRPPLPIYSPNIFRADDLISRLNALEDLMDESWNNKNQTYWKVGEEEAFNQLQVFLQNGIQDYKDGRNFPEKLNVSRLSPYMHFGEISPNQIWYEINDYDNDKNIGHFKSELGWREFSNNLLYFNPDFPTKNFQQKFDNFPWEFDSEIFNSWKNGTTGIPIVDAGMRELSETGYMHNRLRMIVGSFLVKNLLIHWSYGAKWFWECLFDADLANNSAGWQWIAGSGADAAPYFRIFNPILQSQKFDPDGTYIKRFVPELSNLPVEFLFSPWDVNDSELLKYDFKMGDDYPFPIIDLKFSRERALDSFQKMNEINIDS
ncbi:MAG: cryptochrome/photolyase family protein [Dehalococcoidia bacterium]